MNTPDQAAKKTGLFALFGGKKKDGQAESKAASSNPSLTGSQKSLATTQLNSTRSKELLSPLGTLPSSRSKDVLTPKAGFVNVSRQRAGSNYNETRSVSASPSSSSMMARPSEAVSALRSSDPSTLDKSSSQTKSIQISGKSKSDEISKVIPPIIQTDLLKNSQRNVAGTIKAFPTESFEVKSAVSSSNPSIISASPQSAKSLDQSDFDAADSILKQLQQAIFSANSSSSLPSYSGKKFMTTPPLLTPTGSSSTFPRQRSLSKPQCPFEKTRSRRNSGISSTTPETPSPISPSPFNTGVLYTQSRAPALNSRSDSTSQDIAKFLGRMRSNTIDSKPDMGLRLPVSTLQEEEEEEGLADENGIIHDDPGMKPIWNLIIEYGNTGFQGSRYLVWRDIMLAALKTQIDYPLIPSIELHALLSDDFLGEG